MQWMVLPYRRYADFTGRSQRTEYWLFFLLYYGVLVVLGVLMFAGLPWSEFDGRTEDVSLPGPLFWSGFAAIMLFLVVSIVPSIAVTVRRFHDQDLSGWLYLLNFIPYVGALVVFVFMCLDGTTGPNRYGDDPKDSNMAEVFA